MVALCLDHHKRADAGAFSTEQLRAMKVHAPEDPIRGAFDWQRDQLVVKAGGMTAIGCPVILQFGDHDAIWLSTVDQGHQLLNLDVWGSDGHPLFSMRDNDWVTITDVDDLECPPSGKSLVLRAASLGVFLRLTFTAVTREQLRERYHQIGLDVAKESERHNQQWVKDMEKRGAPPEFVASIRDRHSDPHAEAAEFAQRVLDALARETKADEVALCDLTGEFVCPVAIRITDKKLVLPGNNIIGGLIAGGRVGIHIG